VSRERTLTDGEIRGLLKADSAHVPLLHFLLLTGQRIGEAQRATWANIRGARWYIPKEHAKNGRAHWVALSTQALALLRKQDSARDHVFRSVTTTGVQAWLRRAGRRRDSPP